MFLIHGYSQKVDLTEGLDSWVWIPLLGPGFGVLGLDSWAWIPGFESWDWLPGLIVLGLESWASIPALGFLGLAENQDLKEKPI